MRPPEQQAGSPAAPPTGGRSGATPSGAREGVPAGELRRGLEALLFLADEPLQVDALAEVLGVSATSIEATLGELAGTYRSQDRGIEIRAVAGGWRMYTAQAAHPVVERWAVAGRTGRLTQAALETLAVIVYKQPIGRQEISDIRGVNADGAVRSLVARGFVEEVGRDPGPGQAALFGTTRLLLERLGLVSLDELPPLTDFLPENPAPDEPELGTFREVRRRLADGSGLLGGRSAAETNTGASDAAGDDEADLLPPPSREVGSGRGDQGIDALTDQLERAARNAVDRLRAAVRAGEQTEDEPGTEDVPQGPRHDDPADDGPDGAAARDGEPSDG